MLFPDRPHPEHVYELAEFLVDKLLMTRWEGRSREPRRIGFHRACHGRALGLKGEQEMLLASIPGLELVPFAQPEQCCGFGGAFSATHGAISAGIGDEKLRNIVDAGITELVSGDMGCLMHLGGLAKKEGMPLKIRHYAEVLAETISVEASV